MTKGSGHIARAGGRAGETTDGETGPKACRSGVEERLARTQCPVTGSRGRAPREAGGSRGAGGSGGEAPREPTGRRAATTEVVGLRRNQPKTQE